MQLLKWLFILLFTGLVILYMIDKYVSSTGTIYSSTEVLPAKKVALVLGTSKYVKSGGQNYFYTYRIRAALEVWKSGKISAIVVSGNKEPNGAYDEPSMMLEDLVKAGIPRAYITKDNAGFRTLDSILRAEAIFDLTDYIIISQRFHLERALFIVQAKGQKAIGFMAKDIVGTSAYYRMKVREYLARTKAFLDVYVLGTKAKIYGEKVKVTYKK